MFSSYPAGVPDGLLLVIVLNIYQVSYTRAYETSKYFSYVDFTSSSTPPPPHPRDVLLCKT